jgi:hypothetical protein
VNLVEFNYPELFKPRQVRHVGQRRDHVVGNVERRQRRVLVEVLYLLDPVVGQVELLEAGQLLQALDLPQAVALYAEYRQVGQVVEVLQLGYLVLADVELRQADQAIQVLDFLWKCSQELIKTYKCNLATGEINYGWIVGTKRARYQLEKHCFKTMTNNSISHSMVVNMLRSLTSLASTNT